MIQWIIANKELVGYIFASLLFLIVALVDVLKNKGTLGKCLFSLLEKLPALIIDAEKKGFMSGKAKLNYVFQLAVVYLSTLLNKDNNYIIKTYGETIKSYIEAILSTPQKKEVIIDGEKKNVE